MTQKNHAFSTNHEHLLDSLGATDNLLVIQDLDGVCMELVRDPLTRTIDRCYVEATQQLAGHFYVLTNGEHIGSRGVNTIIESVFDTPAQVREQGFYLPGLGAGGVQLQDRYGAVSHPGVTEAELAFLQSVPDRARRFLHTYLSLPPQHLDQADLDRLVASAVLDNLASPTININGFYQHFHDRPAQYQHLQQALERFMRALQQEAARIQLQDSFFVHYAPNLGHDPQGHERLKYSDGDNAGTTDFQFMLKGAIKEVGVLVILNHYYHQHTGEYPLGEHFNARQAPHKHSALLQLARDRFDPAHMPRIVGVGDTVTSYTQTQDGQTQQLRGGSDRGFLTLVQALGATFGMDNTVLYIDSSGGEVRRPGIDAAYLEQTPQAPWPALAGISDPADPLRLDVIFTGGHRQYVAFFCALAERRARRAL
ncbi:glucosylglycerol 3-phosphatase [Azomonas macrocytogenes]|uniref:Glucosylglycerol 3-phosphatase n=1 Tax=Azomonas macrocytogenes TaxID=69962 RepID=A0A839T777_AZOMA|nr:glucosylglycerol 3-phosphatase [Azomonas macrocytogenes]MBB3103523.1 glucosylglycerol 3-phosphatase [Azomonas macrocytogenes]